MDFHQSPEVEEEEEEEGGEMMEMKGEKEVLGGKHHNHLYLLVVEVVAGEIMVNQNNFALPVAVMRGRVAV